MLCVPRSCSCFSFQVPVVPGKLTLMAPSAVRRFYFSRTEMKEGKNGIREPEELKKSRGNQDVEQSSGCEGKRLGILLISVWS